VNWAVIAKDRGVASQQCTMSEMLETRSRFLAIFCGGPADSVFVAAWTFSAFDGHFCAFF
jgi:hypothetical protein